MVFGAYKWTAFMRSAQRTTPLSVEETLSEFDKPRSLMKKISWFGPVFLLILAILVKAAIPNMVLTIVPTLAVLFCGLNLFRLWLYCFKWGLEEAKNHPESFESFGGFLVVMSSICTISTTIAMYFSHDIAVYFVAVVRGLITSTPEVTKVILSGLWGLITQAWHSIVFFFSNFVHHALYGETP